MRYHPRMYDEWCGHADDATGGETDDPAKKKDHRIRRTLWRDGEQEHDLGAWHTLIRFFFVWWHIFDDIADAYWWSLCDGWMVSYDDVVSFLQEMSHNNDTVSSQDTTHASTWGDRRKTYLPHKGESFGDCLGTDDSLWWWHGVLYIHCFLR